jgi:hypothetical protein
MIDAGRPATSFTTAETSWTLITLSIRAAACPVGDAYKMMPCVFICQASCVLCLCDGVSAAGQESWRYRARGFGENALYKILSDHWRTFLGAYAGRFQQTCGALRSVTGRVVERFLDCGNPMNGFARVKCADCGAERLPPPYRPPPRVCRSPLG